MALSLVVGLVCLGLCLFLLLLFIRSLAGVRVIFTAAIEMKKKSLKGRRQVYAVCVTYVIMMITIITIIITIIITTTTIITMIIEVIIIIIIIIIITSNHKVGWHRKT